MGIFDTYCKSKARLDGKVAVITGCNTGIGKETAKDFYLRGCHVIMACRTVAKANEALEDIKKSCNDRMGIGAIEVVELNLCNTKSIRECAQKLMDRDIQINLLINNAGIMTCPFARTDDGFEIQFGTNHLGHFLLTLLLLPKIIKSTPARIVNVSSLAHTNDEPGTSPSRLRFALRRLLGLESMQNKIETISHIFCDKISVTITSYPCTVIFAVGKIKMDDLNWETRRYNTREAYNQSKLCNILFTKELVKRLEDANIQGVNVYVLHPGVIATDLGRHLDDVFCPGMTCCFNCTGKMVLKSPYQGAQTTIYCAIEENAANETGLYYSDCKVKKPSKDARNAEYASRLWAESVKYVNLEGYDPFKV